MQRKRLSTVIYRRLPGSSLTSRQLPSRLIYRYLQRCHIRTRVPLDPWDRSLMVHPWGTVPHARCRSPGLWSRRRCPHPKSPFEGDDQQQVTRPVCGGCTMTERSTHTLGTAPMAQGRPYNVFSSPGTISHANCSQFPRLAVAELRFTRRRRTTCTAATRAPSPTWAAHMHERQQALRRYCARC